MNHQGLRHATPCGLATLIINFYSVSHLKALTVSTMLGLGIYIGLHAKATNILIQV